MKAEEFVHSLETIAEAPNGIAQLRDLLVHLAVHGHLVAQDPTDDPSSQLLSQIAEERVQLAKALNARASRSLPPPTADECPGETPEGWTWVRVGSVTEFHYGKALKASDRHDNGSVPVYGSNGVTGFHDESITSSSAIIVGRKGSAGALNLSATPCWPTDVTYFIQVPSAVDIRYWLLALKSADLPSLAGGIKPGLNRNEAYKIVVGLPPLAEQHRIVARVDELMALLDRLEAAKEARDATRAQLRDAALAALQDANDAEEVKTAWSRIADHMHDLFTDPADIAPLRQIVVQLAVQGRLVAGSPTDEPASELLARMAKEKAALVAQKKIRRSKALPPPTSDEIPFAAPPGWIWCRLQDVGDWGAGATPRRGNDAYFGGAINWFKSGELPDGPMTRGSEETVTKKALDECSLRMNCPGDVLIAMYGATIGKLGLLEVDGTTNQAVCACTPHSGIFNRYLFTFLLAWRSRFIGRGEGGAQPNISKVKIVSTPCALPPLAEQHRIVEKVDELMALLDRLETSLRSSREIQEAFCASAVRALPEHRLGVEEGSPVAVG